MYYIYEVPGIKIGCTDDVVRRVEVEQKFTDYRVLESHSCIYKASEREIELQKLNGYRVDRTPYYKSKLNCETILRSKEVINKRVNNTDYKVIGIKTAERQKGKPLHSNAYSQEAKNKKIHNYKITRSKNDKGIPSFRKPIACFNLEGVLIKNFESISFAAEYFKRDITSISGALRGTQKTAAGYIWKYI